MRRPPPSRRGLRLFTGRLGVVVIAALVLAAMAGTAVLLLGRRSDDEQTERRPAAVQPTGTVFRSRALGVAGIRPPGWRLRSSRRALRLTSPERAAIVAISAVPPSVSASALMSSTVAAVGRSYRNRRLSRRRRAELGGYAGFAVSGSATNSRGVRLDLLISTANGRRRTYLLQVFVARTARLRLVEAQGLVESLELSG